MSKKIIFIIVTVIGVAALAAGIGVLIWWFVDGRHPYTIIDLQGDGFGDIQHHAAFTSIRDQGNMFWWFYPALAQNATSHPILLWLDGVTGLPPSLLAHFGMFGPFDFNLNKRNDSWVNEYNLLLVDAPLGTGFSTVNENDIDGSLAAKTEHLLFTLKSFYERHEEYVESPLYIFGQGHGAQVALSLTVKLMDSDNQIEHNLKGVVVGNGVIAPSIALSKLSFYLFEMGYVDGNGRAVIDEFSGQSSKLVDEESYGEAFDHFLTLEDVINERAGAVAVNLRRVADKVEGGPEATLKDFGKRKYLRSVLDSDVDFNQFMVETVAPALGISTTSYDSQRDAALKAVRNTYMIPVIELVETILQSTNVPVTIYNGNLDAISTVPGQLEWINELDWSGQEEFLSTRRSTLIINNLIEGYYKATERLKFFWIHVAGEVVPLDNPIAMRRVIDMITNKNLEEEDEEESP